MSNIKKFITGGTRVSYTISLVFGAAIYGFLAYMVMLYFSEILAYVIAAVVLVAFIIGVGGKKISKAKYITFSVIFLIPLVVIFIAAIVDGSGDVPFVGEDESKYYAVCPNCGEKITQIKDYCPKCGNKISK